MKNKSKNLGMVDISFKDVTKRVAQACAQVQLGKKAYAALAAGQSPKGNVLEAAKVAGIMAAKSTSSMIPMCHPLELSKVNISFEPNKAKSIVKIFAEVVCLGRTGVEMEALCAVSVAALTIYDMMKWADKGIIISDVKLLYKSGGKSSDYRASK